MTQLSLAGTSRTPSPLPFGPNLPRVQLSPCHSSEYLRLAQACTV